MHKLIESKTKERKWPSQLKKNERNMELNYHQLEAELEKVN